VVSCSGILASVIPAWSAGIQADMDVSGRILRIWMPAIHAGMTKLLILMLCNERQLMNHFVPLTGFSIPTVCPLNKFWPVLLLFESTHAS
jgi:hypothetical protein